MGWKWNADMEFGMTIEQVDDPIVQRPQILRSVEFFQRPRRRSPTSQYKLSRQKASSSIMVSRWGLR